MQYSHHLTRSFLFMLYGHNVDPDENVNVAETPEYIQMADSLSVRMRQWWNQYPNK